MYLRMQLVSRPPEYAKHTFPLLMMAVVSEDVWLSVSLGGEKKRLLQLIKLQW